MSKRVCEWCGDPISPLEHYVHINGDIVCDACEAEFFGDSQEDGR